MHPRGGWVAANPVPPSSGAGRIIRCGPGGATGRRGRDGRGGGAAVARSIVPYDRDLALSAYRAAGKASKRMGDRVATTDGPRHATLVSLPLDLVCVLSLLHRAVPESHFDPWLVETRSALAPAYRDTLDLLHGFSGQRLYYPEEPALRFRPLDADRVDASFETFLAFLLTLSPGDYQGMAERALARVHADLGIAMPAIDRSDPDSWRTAVEPALTTAVMDDVLALVTDPAALKRRTVDLFVGLWESGYDREFADTLPTLREAARLGQALTAGRGFADAFTILTGHRPPAPLVRALGGVRRIAFVPSDYLGNDLSYILAPPDLVVDFGAPEFIVRAGAGAPQEPGPGTGGPLGESALLEAARALADPTRLRIVALLGGGERYAQEIVGHLGIAQSAVSRHLSQLERAGIITVTPRRGSKFYAVNAEAFEALAATFQARAEAARQAAGGRQDQAVRTSRGR
jgi:DNA-binding transcriptional ArsR family regulator